MNSNSSHSSQNTESRTRKDKNELPKNVGIVFTERSLEKKPLIQRLTRKKNDQRLGFDQIACAHLFLQMNKIQSTFDFQIVMLDFTRSFDLPGRKENVLEWLDKQVSIFEREEGRTYNIDYWIVITSKDISTGWFFKGQPPDKNLRSNKYLGAITSTDWEEVNSPPSLFEYIAISVLMCSLYFINHEFHGDLDSHDLVTKGCIFDFTKLKAHRRILVSNPNLCYVCRGRLEALEKKISNQLTRRISLYDDIQSILSRTWMGDPEKRDSPLYNLNKNYKYNVDRNSGFNKEWWEIIRDSITENTAQWIVGGIIGVIFGLLLNFFNLMFHLK